MFDYMLFASLDGLRNFLFNIGNNPSFHYDELKVFFGIVGIAGASIIGTLLVVQLYNYLKTNKLAAERKDVVVKPNTITAGETLDYLIREIRAFIKKWHRSSIWKSSYRRQIQKALIYDATTRVSEHSRKISHGINALRYFRITGTKDTLHLLGSITDKISELGLEVESAFEPIDPPEQSTREKLVIDGDKICDDLKPIILQLESLRRRLPNV